MQKKGELSRLTINLLIGSLIMILGVVIFFIVRGYLEDNGSQEIFTDENIDLKISQVKTVDDTTLDLNLKRGTGEGNFVGLSFAVSDGSLTEIIRLNNSMMENESENFSLSFILLNASRVKKISVTPIYINEEGLEVIGNVKDEYITPNTCSNYCPAGAQCGLNGCGMQCGSGCSSGYLCLNYKCIKQNSGGGGGGSSGGETCTDTCASLVKQCGIQMICGNAVVCGNCPNGYVCSSGLCIQNNTCVSNCAGKNCGSDGCGGSCGNCGEGYNCAVNGTCMKEGTNVKYLVENGKTNSEIIVSSSAPNMVKIAANHLQMYIKNMTGALVPIKNVVNESVAYHIYVGQSNYTNALGITNSECKYGSFKMVSADNYLVLLGNDDLRRNITGPYSLKWGESNRILAEWDAFTGEKWSNPYIAYYVNYNPMLDIWEMDQRGTMNAVYEFLYNQGMRWYYPGEIGTIIPSKKNISVYDINKHVKPDFAMRSPYIYYNRWYNVYDNDIDEMSWQFSLRLNSIEEFLGSSFGHGIESVVSRPEVKSSHPEYYAIWNGVRMNGTNFKEDLCSEGLFDANVRYVSALFDMYDDPMISVMPADAFEHASESSPECMARETPERGRLGYLSDYVFEYVNNLSWVIYNKYPDKKITCGAYISNHHLLPPENLSQAVAPNLVVVISRNRAKFANPEDEEFYRNLTIAWLEKLPSKEIYTWDYYLQNHPGYNSQTIPFFYPHIISEDLKFLKGKINGEFMEVTRNNDAFNLSYDPFAAISLNLYITARLYWDVNQDVDALLNEYYELYYGPASQKMKELIEYSEQHLVDATENPSYFLTLRSRALEARAIAGDTIYGERIDMLIDLMNSKYLGEEVTINSCNVLDSPSTTYKLTSDVSSSGTCFVIEADGITLDCQGHKITYAALGDSSARGVQIWQENYFRIKNCIIQNGNALAGNAIHAYDSNYGIVEYSSAVSSGVGIYFDLGSNNTIRNSNGVSSGFNHAGIYIGRGLNTLVSNSNGSSESSAGILVNGGSNITILNSNGFSNSYRGISISSNYSNVLNSIGTSKSEFGIIFGGSNNILSGSAGYSNSSYGIYLIGSYNNISYSSAISNYSFGLYSNSHHNNIFNLIAKSNEVGIYLEGVYKNNISYTNSTSNSSYGIVLSSNSDNNTLYGCFGISNSNQAYGGIVIGSNSNYNSIINSTGIGNAGSGISISSNNIVYGSKGVSNSSYGIQLSSSLNNEFIDNTAVSQYNTGLRIFGNSNNNNFIRQSAIGGMYGIYISTSTGNTFQDCGTIRGNTTNVSISSDSLNTLFTNCIY